MSDDPSDQPTKTLNLEHTAMTYKSSEVIGIEINATMTIEPGFVLVIPLHRPNALTTMPKAQFHILFPETALAQEPVTQEPVTRESVQKPAQPQTREPVAASDTLNADILAYLKNRKRGVKAKVIAGAFGTTIKLVQERLHHLRNLREVVNDRDIWNPAQRPVPLTKAVSANGTQNVPPQIGRILYAMAYAEKTSGKVDLTGPQVTTYLSQRDKKQYAARLPEAVRRGWVMRGLPLPNNARGWHYQLTSKAREIVKGLGFAPYEGEKAPAWVARL